MSKTLIRPLPDASILNLANRAKLDRANAKVTKYNEACAKGLMVAYGLNPTPPPELDIPAQLRVAIETVQKRRNEAIGALVRDLDNVQEAPIMVYRVAKALNTLINPWAGEVPNFQEWLKTAI